MAELPPDVIVVALAYPLEAGEGMLVNAYSSWARFESDRDDPNVNTHAPHREHLIGHEVELDGAPRRRDVFKRLPR